ncbi:MULTISPECIES: outer membrane protein [unclassified Beijerinckia]|uniref:outer membrane protein n=1 Tax=unclassified Beijerinckia TaxID=2638183 RepID=UPI00089D51CA|nr:MULTISPECIES: outer membrane protein [unclassified Beijerinckia]MDH7795588.1 outer membrane immunogenic protein [Beijerinckia sp. GAS462]SEC07843.1 outer membrane immunogenic protein [Beijerinckia sp. 28-YEA-48]
MRKILLTAAALSAMASTAMAADLPRRAPAPAPAPIYVAPIFTWTGFYVGGQIGGGWGRSELAGFGYNANGVVGGLHAGYNQQFGMIVAGVEGDIEATSLKGSGSNFFGSTFKTRAPWQGSLRARVGVAAFDRALIYATGGVAFASIRNEVFVPPFASSTSTTRAGWTVGAGVEYAIDNNWSVRAEYRYTDFGRFNVGFFPLGSANTRFKENTVRVGVSYRFGSAAGPVLARY